MSYANGTTHYNLPQTVGTDKRDWFDTNAAFAAVDAALYAAATGQASDAEAITALQQTVAGQATDIAGLGTLTGQHTSQIAALNTTVNNLGTEVSDVRQDAEDMITANNEGAAATSTRAYAVGDYFIYNDVLYKATAAIAIGDTIIPNTNCIATNVDTELTQINSDLATKQDKLKIHTLTNITTDVNGVYITDIRSSNQRVIEAECNVLDSIVVPWVRSGYVAFKIVDAQDMSVDKANTQMTIEYVSFDYT